MYSATEATATFEDAEANGRIEVWRNGEDGESSPTREYAKANVPSPSAALGRTSDTQRPQSRLHSEITVGHLSEPSELQPQLPISGSILLHVSTCRLHIPRWKEHG